MNDKKGIILYLTTGNPDNETTAELALELFNSGADIIELGIPFSDPLADGVTIQQSSQKALEKGLLLYPGGHHLNVLAFLPPIVVEKEEVDTCLLYTSDAADE